MNTEKKIDAIMRYIVADSRGEKDKIMEELKAMIGSSENEKKTEGIEYVISEFLVELGMPSHIKGYLYTVCAIKLAVENPGIIGAITGELYPSVAKNFNTTGSRVERAIRHGIELVWDRTDFDVIEKYFGNTISLTKGRPTNSEFIARVANIVKRKML
jgi:two-component system response regulator (stage 0 sporulation protein A)